MAKRKVVRDEAPLVEIGLPGTAPAQPATAAAPEAKPATAAPEPPSRLDGPALAAELSKGDEIDAAAEAEDRARGWRYLRKLLEIDVPSPTDLDGIRELGAELGLTPHHIGRARSAVEKMARAKALIAQRDELHAAAVAAREESKRIQKDCTQRVADAMKRAQRAAGHVSQVQRAHADEADLRRVWPGLFGE